jgi:hypothetical protein
LIDGNLLRAEFAKYLNEHTHTRWGLDAALMHVCRMAYEQGVKDGEQRREVLLPVWDGRAPLEGLPLANVCYVCGDPLMPYDSISADRIGGLERLRHVNC